MKTFITALLLTVVCNCWCQQSVTFPVVLGEVPYNWKSIEKKVPRPDVDRFINAFPKEFAAYRYSQEYPSRNLDSLANALHFIDVNADGKTDVIFDGQGPGEGRLIEVYIRNEKGYKKLLSEYQGIAKIDWEGARIKRLYIYNWGCCADYTQTNKIFEINYNQSAPAVKQIYQSICILMTNQPAPDSLFQQPIRFEVLNDKYNIRGEPKIDDTAIYIWHAETNKKIIDPGNTIGKLPLGSTGTAFGKSTDATGRVWWYVEMDLPYKPEKDVFYVGNNFPTRVIGWVSSRFVKVL
jgi:hypothetical protein